MTPTSKGGKKKTPRKKSGSKKSEKVETKEQVEQNAEPEPKVEAKPEPVTKEPVTGETPSMKLRFRKRYENARIPERGSDGAAGYDLYPLDTGAIHPRGRTMVSTGLDVAIPEGYVGLVWPRSGLAVKAGLDTGAGVIDSDYRGHLRVVIFNHSDETVHYNPEKAIAQLVIQKVETLEVEEVDSLDDTERGEGGFGSTDTEE